MEVGTTQIVVLSIIAVVGVVGLIFLIRKPETSYEDVVGTNAHEEINSSVVENNDSRREDASARELAREDGSIGLVKRLIRQSGGAREFIALASQSGFAVESEDGLGLYMVGHDCRIVLSVLASRGSDRIWSLLHSSLLHRGKKTPSLTLTLINEGRRTF